MTVSAERPPKSPPDEVSPEDAVPAAPTQLPPTQSPPPQSPATQPASRRPVVLAVLCTVGCVAVMACVLALAHRDGAEAARHGGDVRAGASDAEVMGTHVSGRPPHVDLTGCGTLDPDHPPEIEFFVDGEALDFGVLKQGVKVEHEVRFKNIGTGPLCIAKVTTGCGCVKATLVGDEKRFPPEGEGRIRLATDTTGRVGRISKYVSVFTNDMKVPVHKFRIVMDVSAGLMTEPRYLQFGNVPPNTPATRTMILRSSKSEKGWKVLRVESTRKIAGRKPPKYTFEVIPVPDARYDKVRLRITHPGYAELGAIRDVLAITTTHPDRKRIEVPAHIHVVPRILCRSRVISLGFVQAGMPRPPSRARVQAGAAGVTFRITGLDLVRRDGTEAGPSGLGFAASFGEDARGWYVDVKYDGKSRGKGLLNAMLRIHTDDPLQPVVSVPVRATIR